MHRISILPPLPSTYLILYSHLKIVNHIFSLTLLNCISIVFCILLLRQRFLTAPPVKILLIYVCHVLLLHHDLVFRLNFQPKCPPYISNCYSQLANSWFSSYLSNRKQNVSLNGVSSTFLEIGCGVPQGSILGPLLFLIYINDMHVAVKNSIVHHFADDTNLLYSHKNAKIL